jgi:anti-anti-sigma factor
VSPPPHDAPSGDFSLRTEVRDASLEVVLAGELDMAASFAFESAVDRLLAARDVRELVLDLADVAFVDSAGLGALLSIRERTKQLGIELAIERVSAPVQRVLDLTGSGGVLRETGGPG